MSGILKRFYYTWYIDDGRLKQIVISLLIVMSVLLLSAGIAYKLPANQMKLILLLPFGLIGINFLLRWPPLGLVILTIGGMLIPFTGPNNVNATIMLAGLLFGLWAQDIIILKRQRPLPTSSTMLPLGAFVASSILAFFSGQIPWYSFVQNAPVAAQLGGFAMFALAAAAFILVADQVQDIKWLRWMTWAFLGVGSLYIIGQAVPGLSFYTRKIFQPQSIGGMFWAWLGPMALAQAAFNRDLDKKWRIALAVLFLASIYSGYFQNGGWKSSWVSPMIGIACIIAAYSWRLALVMALLSIVPASLIATEALADDAYSVSTRLEAWIIMGQVVKANPILGLGFSNYYWYTPLFNIRGYEINFNSHNNYVDIVAQTGLVGLGCCLWLLMKVGWVGYSLRERVPAGFARAYVYGAFGGWGATVTAAMLGDWMLPFVYNIGMNGFRTGILCWLFLGGLVAIEQMLKDGRLPQTS